MSNTLKVVKVGGRQIEDELQFDAFIRAFAALKGPKILVHGGGARASSLERQLGLTPRMIGGRRITGAKSLEVVVMVYAGLLNKKIVTALQARQCNALGLSGADANLIRATRRPVTDLDYGFAGDIETVDHGLLRSLLALELCPVCCALTHDGKGQLLNTNADTIAAELAIAMSKAYQVSLDLCFDLPGVMEDPDDHRTLLNSLDRKGFEEKARAKTISGGMLPKLQQGFYALEKGVRQVRLGNAGLLVNEHEPHTRLVL